MTKSILYVTPSLGIGGAERHLLRVATGLKERGYNISFFCFGPTGDIGKQLVDLGLDVSSSETRTIGSLGHSLKVLYGQIRDEKPDIVHFFLPKAYILGAPVARLAGHKRLIMSRRSLNYYQQKHPLAGWVERRLHGLMSAVVGNSKKVIGQLQNEEGVSPAKLKLIYNGIEEQKAPAGFDRTTFRKILGISETALVMIIVANLIPYKGHEELIEGLSLIKDKLPDDWALLCVGRNDGIQADLIAKAEKAGIAGHIQFLGSRDDIPALLHASDIGLLNSHEEGFSNAILEAMSAGLPMIVTDVGGNAEAVIDGENGYVVPAKDPESWSQALLKLLDNPQVGKNNRQRVCETFSMEKCLDGYEDLYG